MKHDKLEDIIETLDKMKYILYKFSEFDWHSTLDEISKNIKKDPEYYIFKILSLYGGMGSLNDIVIQKNGFLPVEENNYFYLLRIRLYDLCKHNNWR